MTSKIVRTGLGLALASALWVGMSAAPARAQKVALGIPVTSITANWIYVADAMGFWKDQGLDVDPQVLGGAGDLQAAVAGDIQFALLVGTAVLNAVGHGQSLVGIAAIHERIMDDLFISNEAAARTGLTLANSTAQQRAKALKGMTIAIDAPNTINDAFLTYVLKFGGLDPQKDVVRTPITPSADPAAVEAKRIDGFASAPPWTTIAEQKGLGVKWISGVRGDMPSLQPIVFTTAAARPDYCAKNPDTCIKFVTGVKRAQAFMVSNPDKSEEIIAAKLNGMDRSLVHEDFLSARSISVPDAKFTEEAWKTTQRFDVETGLIPAANQLTTFEGKTYTNAYVK